MFTTPAEIYEHSFRIHATRPAVREDDREFTYRDIWAWSDATIDLLRELGVGPGDVVAMYAGNRAEWIVFDSAVARLGAVKTPANYMSALDTVLYQLEFAGASVVITDYDLGSALAEREVHPVPWRDASWVTPSRVPLASHPLVWRRYTPRSVSTARGGHHHRARLHRGT